MRFRCEIGSHCTHQNFVCFHLRFSGHSVGHCVLLSSSESAIKLKNEFYLDLLNVQGLCENNNKNQIGKNKSLFLNLCPVLHPDSLQKSNQAMKERFEGLSAWREKQQEERGLLESSLEKATSRLEAVTAENQELRTKLEELSAGGKVRTFIVLRLFVLPRLFLMPKERDICSLYSRPAARKASSRC